MDDERQRIVASDLRQRTTSFAVKIVRFYSDLPKTTVAQVLGRQLLRSGTSVGAQYRETKRAKSNADFISKVEGALQELEETAYWLELLETAGVIPETTTAPLRAETDELTAILVASVKTAKRRK